MHIFNSLQDEIFQKFSYDTEWAVQLISRINNNEEVPIEGGVVVKQVRVLTLFFYFKIHVLITVILLLVMLHNFQLLGLQINAEKYFFGIRKSLVEFDEVLEVCT